MCNDEEGRIWVSAVACGHYDRGIVKEWIDKKKCVKKKMAVSSDMGLPNMQDFSWILKTMRSL